MNSNDMQIDPELKRQLNLLKDTPSRDQQAAAQGRENYLNLALTMNKPVSNDINERSKTWIPFNYRKKRRSIFTAITTFIVVIVMLLGGASATVYAAQGSTPDDILYPVKSWSEDIQLSLTKNTQAKFDLLQTYSIRRFDEAATLWENNEPVPSGLVTRLENHLKHMLQLAAQMKDEEKENALIRIQSMLQEREQLMTKQGENVPEWANPVFAQIRQLLSERLRRNDSGTEEPPNLEQPMDGPSGGYGPGPDTGSGNPDEISPIPPEQGEDKPIDPGKCDPAQQECGTDNEPGNNAPSESPTKVDETPEPIGPGESQKQNDNPPGNGSGGKP